MKKRVLTALGIVLLTVTFSVTLSAQNAKAPRKPADFVKELLALSGADKADPKPIVAERSDGAYQYVKLMKGNHVVGYGTWAHDVKIYNHREDFIAIINPDATLKDFKLIDANEKHPKANDPSWKAKFVGMNYKRNFNNDTDVNTGSTFSSYMFFAEMKGMLFAFQKYVVEAKLLK